jgi:hypothetical protein
MQAAMRTRPAAEQICVTVNAARGSYALDRLAFGAIAFGSATCTCEPCVWLAAATTA